MDFYCKKNTQVGLYQLTITEITKKTSEGHPQQKQQSRA